MSEIKLPHDHGNDVSAVIANMPTEAEFALVSELFRQISDASRIRIFWILCHCEECVSNISAMVKMTNPAVSHHLKNLKASGLIVGKRKGKEVYYRASDTKETELLHFMIEKMFEITCPNT